MQNNSRAIADKIKHELGILNKETVENIEKVIRSFFVENPQPSTPKPATKAVRNRIFENVEQINEFINAEGGTIISIETVKVRYDTGLPLPNGTFWSTKDNFKLWYIAI